MASYLPIKTGKETTSETGSELCILLLRMLEQQGMLLAEIQLLNARFEAMAETHINRNDVEK